MNRMIAALVWIAVLALPAGAGAASIAYVGPDGNVWLTSPDGSTRKQLTQNATAQAPYRSPTQLNDGRVMALRRPGDSATSFAHFLRRSDGYPVDSWLLPKSGSGGFSPYTGAHISPEGGIITYDYRHFDCPLSGCYGNQRVGFVSGPGQTNPCLTNCHQGYVAPRWLPNSPYAAMISQNFRAIYFQQQGSAHPVGWFQYGEGFSIVSFDVRGGKIAVAVEYNGSEYLVIERMNGPAPALPTTQCSVNLPDIDSGARPRLSPDGSMVAWATPQGVMSSPTPTQSGGLQTMCQLAPKLVGPGGTQPDWGVADVPDETPPNASVAAVAGQKLGGALRNGVRLAASCSERCRVNVSLYLGPAAAQRFGWPRKRTLVASGSAAGGPGGVSLRALFTGAARNRLARARGVTFQLDGAATDLAGNRRTLGGSFTLRR